MTTTTANYESDLVAAAELMKQFVDFSAADGNMRKWAMDALNNEWREGLTIAQWVAQARVRMNHGQ